MANSAKLTDGATEYEFVYDSATQDDYKLRYGMRVGGGEPRPLWHRPDNGEQKLVRLNNDNQTIFLTTIVYGTDRNDVLNNLTKIKRWVDGDDQQAARYHTDGDVDKIVCRIQLDGATNYTDWTVVYGNVDDSGAFYEVVADRNTIALDVIVMLVCEPLGQGAPITLRNDLPSSPHCLEDSNSDGLPDGWTEVNNPTTSLYTVSYVVGGQCMRVDTTASGQGVYIRTTITASADLAAYVWVSVVSSNQVNISLRSNNGANVIDSGTLTSTDSNGIADKSVVINERTWYRVPLSGTASAHTNAEIRLTTISSGAQVFFCDAAYLQQGTLTVPDAFMSASDIENRYDPTNTNQSRINYIDIWGVPGDSDALIEHELTNVSGTDSATTTMIGVQFDNVGLATKAPHWVDSTDMTLAILSGSQTTTASASRLGGSYIRHTADASSVDDAQLTITVGASITEFLPFSVIPHRVFLVARSSSTATKFTLQSSRFATVSGSATIIDANSWGLYDIGYITAAQRELVEYENGAGRVAVTVTPGATSATVDIDAVLFMPALDGGFVIIDEDFYGLKTFTNGTVYDLNSYYSVSKTGNSNIVMCGNKTSRFIYAYLINTNAVGIDEHLFSNVFQVTYTIYPRTRHLLGTS